VQFSVGAGWSYWVGWNLVLNCNPNNNCVHGVVWLAWEWGLVECGRVGWGLVAWSEVWWLGVRLGGVE